MARNYESKTGWMTARLRPEQHRIEQGLLRLQTDGHSDTDHRLGLCYFASMRTASSNAISFQRN